MYRRFVFLAIAGVLIFGLAGGLFAQRGGRGRAEVLEVKIASPLPRESPWGRTLDRIAAEWGRVTNNQVRLRVLHGGTEGGEGKMHLSMSSNTIQAAVYTSVGLSTINSSLLTISAPFLIRTYDELDFVLGEMQGELESRFNSGDFFIVAWSKVGFVNIFSKEPVFTPDDLRRMRLGSNAEASEMNTAFKSMGFHVEESDWVDAGTKIATGVVSAIYQSPAAVAAYQIHAQLGNMLSTNIAPILGGIVINQVTWRRIGELNPGYQQELLGATRRITDEFDRSMQRTLDGAIQTMTREGLTVNRPSAAQERIWYAEIERVMPSLLGTTYDRALYTRISEILARFRGRR